MSRGDKAIGIALGVVVGLVALILFLFTGGESSVDNASLSGSAKTRPKPKPKPRPRGVRTVPVVSGGPPGPLPQLRFRQGQQIRFRVSSRGLAIVAKVVGYGVKHPVGADRTVALSFPARRAGQFPVVVEATHIGIARLIVAPRR